MRTERWPRRILLFGALLVLLVPFGLYPLLASWSGRSGRPPVRRLYVPGAFAGDGALLELRGAAVATGGPCYHALAPGERARGDSTRVCAGEHLRPWVGDGQIEVVVGTDGVPAVSLSGARLRPGDWIGSNADPGAHDAVRFPFRGYGVPGRAAQVEACGPGTPAGPHPAGCVRVHDRLGRLAVARAGGRGDGGVLDADSVYPLYSGDELWLGLVAFRVSARPDGGAGLVLERENRVRGGSAGAASDRRGGGDRRWLGRLWMAEGPDRDGALPTAFEVVPARRLFTKRNLARRRTSLEVEDVVQEMIDAELLCLERGGDSARVAWRPVDRPGCAASAVPAGVRRAVDEQLGDRYRRVRWGDMAPTATALVNGANASLAGRGYLLDVSSLPLAFDWRLEWRASTAPGTVGLNDAQPAARALWGVRFGSTRFNDEPRPASALPAVFLRASTARYVVQAVRGDGVLASFSLAGAQGRVCLGTMAGTSLNHSSGNHHPLGAFAFGSNPRVGTWNPNPATRCDGCSLDFRPAAGAGRGAVAVTAGTDCPRVRDQDRTGVARRTFTLGDGGWVEEDGGLRLRVADRGEHAWATLSGVGGRRRFVDEFYRRGGLAPLLGDPGGLRGVEAALRDFGGRRTPDDSLPPLELSIDGDLQLAVQSIVDTLAPIDTLGGAEFVGESAVSALVLDALTGEVLAVANSRSDKSPRPPSAWEAGAQLARGLENTAFQRRRPLGSTLKVVGAYALVNSGLSDGAAPSTARAGWTVPETRLRDSAFLFVARQRPGGTGPASGRKCTTGRGDTHLLPAADGAFNRGTLVERFAESCNSFFVMIGFRHAGPRTASLRTVNAGDPPLQPGEMGMRVGAQDSALLMLGAGGFLADQVRDGLAEDLGGRGGGVPHSIYGLLVRSGFQPWPGGVVSDPRPASFTFQRGGAPVTVPLAAWFAPATAGAAPALLPGRDFSYPRVPSPARLDPRTTRTPVMEALGGRADSVRRDAAQGTPEAQYAQLLIGQGQVEGSVLALSVLYAAAARPDGHTVHPCLFQAQCAGSAGAPLLDRGSPAAAALNSALSAVLSSGTASRYFGANRWDGLRRRWGGKTGTYDQEIAGQAERDRQAEWRRLADWACGVVPPFATRPGVSALVAALRPNRPAAAAAAEQAASAPSGAARGARACEDAAHPLNPAGIHAYGTHAARRDLDAAAAGLSLVRSARATEAHHAFVLAALPGSGRAEGIVIAVLVDDHDTQAVPIGGEIALAVERWAEVARR